MGTQIEYGGYPPPNSNQMPILSPVVNALPVLFDNITGNMRQMGRANFSNFINTTIGASSTFNLFFNPTVPITLFVYNLVLSVETACRLTLSDNATVLMAVTLAVGTPFVYSAGYRPIEFAISDGHINLNNLSGVGANVVGYINFFMSQ